MRLNRSWVVGTALLFAVAPAFAAAPFGILEGLGPDRNGGGGILGITGWALDDDGVERVELFVDGRVDSIADYGQHRPDVDLVYPGYPDDPQGGFGLLFDSTPYPNGLHTLSARVTSNSGEQVFLNDVVLQFTNTTSTLVPFGAITYPNPSAELFGNCDISDPFRRYSVIEGWALDQGVEIGDTGVKYVELLINGSIYANSHLDCFWDDNLGGFVNCYGLPSLDVEDLFPAIANSPHARFRFVLDVGALIDFGYAFGFHELTIRVGDIAGQVANVAEIPVVFYCQDEIGNQGSFGYIDNPTNGDPSSGLVDVSGWTLDAEGVDLVKIWLDGDFVGFAAFGLLRPDVTDLFPGYPDSLAPGFGFTLDTAQTNDGVHHLQVEVIDDLGASTIIGERWFTVRNEAP
jgi:hypothetical protein